ncbi:uncharacterized protein [Palaemon carinicauda]|uniref:uncharacterized protein isoform X1 n=1 Tax=Palaemon carinicauda TaxID=392227 RepID=UPI0035B5DFE9
MFGFFLWICLLLDLWLTSFAQEENPKNCFLYPVSEQKNSPVYNIEGADEHFVTINHIFRKSNVVRFLNQNGECFLALKQNTSETVDCIKSLQADGEYTTLVFRRSDDILTVHKKTSPFYNIDLHEGIQTLEISSSDMVNIVFNCHGNCFTFEKATIALYQNEQASISSSYSSFIVHGRIKPSANNWNLVAEVMLLRGGQNKSLDFESLAPDGDSNGWFSLKFSVTFEQTFSTHVVGLIVTKSPWNSSEYKIHKSLSLLSKDLHLNFNSSNNVLWSVNCKPRNEVVRGLSCKPNNDSTLTISCQPGWKALRREKTDCYAFEKAMVHINYTEEVSNSSFVIYGKSQSPAHEVPLGVMQGTISKSFKNITLLVPSSDDWFQIEFHVVFRPYQKDGTYPFYPLYLEVFNPLRTEVETYSLTVATKDLYLNFSASEKVRWAVSCQPGKEMLTSCGEKGIYIIILACLCGIFALIAFALTLYKCCLGRDRPVSLPTSPAPPPASTDPTTEDTTEVDKRRSLAEHLYEYVDLTAFREQITKENSHSLENSPEEHGASEERNSHTSVNSVYGLSRDGEN